MFRHLRYLPAVAFALLALAFVGLWVRSYYSADYVSNDAPHGHANVSLSSLRGSCYCSISRFLLPYETTTWRWRSVELTPRMTAKSELVGALGFNLFHDQTSIGVVLPHWLLALSSVAVATLLAFKPITRFTVRGLLVATTLFAAVLGLVVYVVSTCCEFYVP